MASKMGRPPKSAALHRLQGTFEPARHAMRELLEPPAVGELPPTPPEWMSPLGKRVWTATVPFLTKGVVGGGDVEIMAAFCEAAAKHRQAVEAQTALDAGKALPLLTKTKAGDAVASPYLRIARQEGAAMARFGEALGLTPAARARIGAMRFAPDAATTTDVEDPWSAFSVIDGGKR